MDMLSVSLIGTNTYGREVKGPPYSTSAVEAAANSCEYFQPHKAGRAGAWWHVRLHKPVTASSNTVFVHDIPYLFRP